MKNFWVGLDIGGTKCSVVLAKVDGGIHILDKIRFATHSEEGFHFTYHRLCSSIDEIIERNHLAFSDVHAIGISCGGPLDAESGVVLSPPNLPGWDHIPLTEMLNKKYGIPAFLENDANACALVEWKMGAGRGTSDMVFLTMGTGMGAGIIANGKLIRGFSGMGGEVGHLRLRNDGPFGYGKKGSFEGFCSGGGLQQQALELTRSLIAEGKMPAWSADGHSEKEIDARLMAEYARRGDADAVRFFNRAGHMLGCGISAIADLLNPERIVIGSIFARCEDLLRPSMEEALREETIPVSLRGLSVLPAETQESLGDLAAVMAALYPLNIDPMEKNPLSDPTVIGHYERLFRRYPLLEPCRKQISDAYLSLLDCYRNGSKILLVGNGGSCSDCEHIVGELMKGFYLKRPLTEDEKSGIDAVTHSFKSDVAEHLQKGLPAIALTGHNALSTAVQNDCDPCLAPAQQVMGYGKPGDIVIGISSSGNSRNVVLALGVARGLGLKTMGLTGESGGIMKSLCDDIITVPAVTPADVQEFHLPVYHTLCAMLESTFFKI